MQKFEVILRTYFESDDIKTVGWLNDPDMRETFGLTYSVDEISHRKWLEAQSDYLIKAIEIDQEHIGNAILRSRPRHQSASLEIYIGEAAYRGKGLGFRALKLLLSIAFEEMKLHRVSLVTRPDNKAAEHMYQKAGFVHEGREREAICYGDTFGDQNLWGILRSEWVALNYV